MRGIKTEEIKAVESPNLSGLEIFYHYVLKNKNAWYVAWMDTFVYMVRFGLISWLPIYLLETKGFNKEQIGASLGTKAIGWAVDYYGSWNAGLIMLLSACILCILCSILCHFGTKKKEDICKK